MTGSHARRGEKKKFKKEVQVSLSVRKPSGFQGIWVSDPLLGLAKNLQQLSLLGAFGRLIHVLPPDRKSSQLGQRTRK